jgi:regulator of nonsense transcripts 2
MKFLHEVALSTVLHVQVLRKLRRLSWKEHEPYLVHTMLGATKGRYDDLPYVAALCGGLSQYHPSLGVALADALLEQVCLLGAFLCPEN